MIMAKQVQMFKFNSALPDVCGFYIAIFKWSYVNYWFIFCGVTFLDVI